MSRARHIAWAASAALHLTAGVAVLTAIPPPAAEVMPVMLIEMPEPMAPEPEAEPIAEPLAAAPTEPAPPEPPPPEPSPQLAEVQPEPPPQVVPPPEPPSEPPPPPEELAFLPMPPPPPPPKPVVQQSVAPRRQPPPRPAALSPLETPTAPAPAAAVPATVARVAAAPSPSYAALLMRALERHRRYPEEARYRRVEGITLLRFSMSRDGTVTGYRIERSSGNAALDQAVQTMIQNASPLPAPPEDLPGNPVELTVPIRFTLK